MASAVLVLALGILNIPYPMGTAAFGAAVPNGKRHLRLL